MGPERGISIPEVARKHNRKEVLDKTQFVGWPSSIGIKDTWYGTGGFRINAKLENSHKVRRKVAGRIARHEIKHAIVDPENVESITIIPGPGYLGLTQLRSPDPVAALAPHATGEGGTGHDVMVASFMTDNVSSAENVAKGIVQNNTEEIEQAASLLEEKKTMTGNELKQAINSVRNKEEVQKVTIFVKSPDGSERSVPNLDVKNDVVILPPKEQIIPSPHYELPKEGIIFSRN